MKTEKPIQKTSSAKQAAAKSAPVAKKVEEQPIVEKIEEPIVEEVKPVVEVVEPVVEVAEPVVEEEAPVSTYIEEDPDRFNLEIKDIARVIRRSPLITEVLLVSGDTVQINTDDFEKLRNPNDPTSIIQYL